jgi:N-methylhydantoinase A
VVVPCDPGTFSATGLASASPGVETTQTVLSRVEDAGRGARVYRSLERQALAKLKAQGVAGGITIARFADLRYEGQSHEITVPCSAGMARAFVRAHRARYGHVRAEAGIELVTARVRASARATRGAGARRERPARGGPVGAAMVPILHGGRWVRAIGVRRDLLRPGVSIAGPARLSEYSSTTYVPPGWRGVIEEAGDLVLFPGRRGE